MAIGYYNFSNIQQGNQSVVNSMAGLGQSISNAIQTHAATESAKTMLPMLQQQYQVGMEKIAAGKPEGLADIYGASLVASQNPLLAPMANHAVSMANMANQQVMHNLRTYATIGARASGAIKPLTPVQLKAAQGLRDTYQQQMDDASRKGDPVAYARAQQQMQQLTTSLAQFPSGSGETDMGGTAPDFQKAQQISSLNQKIKAENAKKGWSKPDQSKIQEWQNQLQQLSSGGGGRLPAVQGGGMQGGGVPVTPPQAHIDALLKNPDKKDDFDAKYGKGAADQYLKNPKTGSIDTGDGRLIAQETPEETDPTQAESAGDMAT